MAKGRGDPMVFFDRPIAATLGVITLSIWILPPIYRMIRSFQNQSVQA
jgi:TctA family transporter